MKRQHITDKNIPEGMLNQTQAAQLLGMSYSNLCYYLKKGRVPHRVNSFGRRVFDRAELLEFLKTFK